MSSENTLIKVNDLAKKFCRDPKRSLRYGLQDIGSDLLSKPKPHDQLRDDEFWALKDVSLQICRGDSIGIIGNNGAGKSTLLKLLAGILKPDYGTITVNGKPVALLEVGAGFNSLLTGRENIYMNGALADLRTREIDLLCDEIIDFAELAEFIDSPLRTYSTGMRSRLGFALAVVSKPDILMLDETLAVGDISFRAKCEEKMKQLTNAGVAIVVVSQQMYSVMRATQQCLWIEKGKILAFGKTNNVCASYINSSLGPKNVSSRDISLKDSFLASDGISEVKVELVDNQEKPILSVCYPQKIWIDFEFLATSVCTNLSVSFRIAGRAGVFADNLIAPFEIEKTRGDGVHRVKGKLMLNNIPAEKEAYVLRMNIYSEDRLIYKAPEAHFFVVEERRSD